MTATATARAANWRMPPAILKGGLVAGALDLAAAILTNLPRGIEPVSIMQSIATGLLGRDAYAHGLASAALGVLLHFAMMLVIAAIFYAASRRLPVLVRHAITAGTLYGIAVYLFMQFVVLPLSAFPHPTAHTAGALLTGIATHIACVGLPIALFARRG